MTRLFYECPLQAAYMIKNFGIKTENLLIEDWGSRVMLDAVDFKFHKFTGKTKIYVAPVSEHIFEYKEKDMLNGGSFVFSLGGELKAVNMGGLRPIDPDEKIIMRDNKQFFAPMKETT